MILALAQTRFRRRLTRAIVLPIVLLLFLSSIFIWQTTQLVSALRWVDHTNQVISQANYTQKLLLDRETGLRGYLLAGRQNFLEPYEQASDKINASLEELKRRVADNPGQVQRVTALIAQSNQWEQQVPPAITRKQRGEPEPLNALERRKQSMDRMRQKITEFIATEEQLRNQRSQVAQQTTQSVILSSLLLALGVGAVLAYFLRRQILQVSRSYEDALHTAQVKTEEAQRSAAALQQYKDIFQFAEHGLVMGAPDDQTLALMNPAFARMHGYTVEELLGTPILNLFPLDCHAEAIEFIQHVNERGYYAVESQHCRKDGTVFPVFLSGTAVRDVSGNLLYRIVSVHDITENKQAKLALQRSAQRLAALHEIDRAILATETDEALISNALAKMRQVVPHQQAFVAVFDLAVGTAQVLAGSSQTEELSLPVGTLLTVTDFAPEQSLLHGIRYVENLATAEDCPRVLRQLRSQGFCSCLCVPLLVENTLVGELSLAATEPAAFDEEAQEIAREVADQLAIALQQSRLRHQLQATNQQLQRELQERQQIERSLREREERLRLFIEYAPVSIAMFDREMHYVALSQRWIDEYHLDSIESVLGKSHYEIFPNIPDYWRKVHQRGLAGHSETCDEDRFVLPDGTEQYLRWEVQPWFDDSGTVSGILIFVEDITARKRVEIALVESEQQFRATFNQAAVGIAHVSLTGQWLRVNQKLCEIVGYTHEEVLQRTFQDMTYAEDLDSDLDYVRQMLADEIQTYSMEKRYIRKDGSLVWINLTVSLVREVDGQPKYFISIVEDIHDRKIAQLHKQFLNDLDFRLRQLSSADAMEWEAVSRIGEYLQVERCVWFEINLQEDVAIARQDWRQREDIPSVVGVFPISQFSLPEIIAQYQAGEPVVVSDVATYPATAPFARSYEERGIRAYIGVPCLHEGRLVANLAINAETPQQWQSHQVSLLQEAVARLWSLLLQTRAVEALRNSEERIRLATEAAQLGMWFWNIPQNKLIWTDRCKAIFGLVPETPISYEVFLNALHPDDRDRAHAAVTQALEQRGEYNIEYRTLWQDGSTHWIAAKGRAYYDASDNPLHLMGTVQDITERKQAEADLHQLNVTLEQRVAERTAQLEETNQELEAFTYSVSHDLRAPLRTIQGFAKALLEDCGEQLEDFCRSYIDSIIEDAVQMNLLISDLLNYSRLTRTQIKLQPTALDDVVKEALKQLTAQIQETQAQIQVAVDLPPVMAHRSTLIQVITNLISNAIKFVEPNMQPQIDIFVEEAYQNDERWIRLWIVDNGIGIAPEHQERVFWVFERLHGAEHYPGTGIGLAIVRKGLERMGGQVGVESQLGQGSRFWIALLSAVLPLNDSTHDPTSPNPLD